MEMNVGIGSARKVHRDAHDPPSQHQRMKDGRRTLDARDPKKITTLDH